MDQANVEEILTIKEVQLHEVANGQEKLKEWGPLQMTMHSHDGTSGLWLQVGKTEWSVVSSMPTLEASENTFMFAMAGGRFFSVLLAASTPREESLPFKEILIECTSFEHAGAMTKEHTDDLVAEVAQSVVEDDDLPVVLDHHPQEEGATPTAAERIVSGAAVVQDKLMASAGWASRKILERSQSYRENHPATQDPVNISPAFAKRVKMARKAAEMSSRAANKVAGGIADVSVKMADSIIKHLGPSRYGEELSNPQTKPHAAKEIAGAAVLAAVGIYDSMEQASRVVLNSGGQATSEFVGHKYGAAAGDVAKDAAHATVTTGMTVMTVQKIGVKKVARKIAKRTATGLVKSYVMPGKSSGGQQAQVAGPSASGRPADAGQGGPGSTLNNLQIQSEKAAPGGSGAAKAAPLQDAQPQTVKKTGQ